MLEATLMLPSLLMSLYYRDGDALGFLYAISVILVVGGVLSYFVKPVQKDLFAREGLAVAGLGWIVMSALGGLPLVFSGVCNFWDALFEITSGFTTTGATIFLDVEALPHGILFWRCFTHWIGGMGVLVLTTALLPSAGVRGSFLARAETPGPAFSKLKPKLGDSSKVLYIIYAALTLFEALLLFCAGMSPFDAITHALSTAGTGGFSNRAISVGAYDSVAVEIIIACFMLFFGVNFAVYFKLLSREFKSAFGGEETRTYLILASVCTLVVAVSLIGYCGGFLTALRQSFFQVTSIMSTTGFSSTDFNLWPTFPKALLLLLMIPGSCAGSTAGGLKMIRGLLLVKLAGREVRRAFQPRKVHVIKLDGKPVPEEMLSQISVFFFFYIFLLLVGSLVLSLSGVDTTSAFTGSLACISNIGPGLSAVGPLGSFAVFSPAIKVFLSFLMLVGRLEIFPILALFTVSFWKNN